MFTRYVIMSFMYVYYITLCFYKSERPGSASYTTNDKKLKGNRKRKPKGKKTRISKCPGSGSELGAAICRGKEIDAATVQSVTGQMEGSMAGQMEGGFRRVVDRGDRYVRAGARGLSDVRV